MCKPTLTIKGDMLMLVKYKLRHKPTGWINRRKYKTLDGAKQGKVFYESKDGKDTYEILRDEPKPTASAD